MGRETTMYRGEKTLKDLFLRATYTGNSLQRGADNSDQSYPFFV